MRYLLWGNTFCETYTLSSCHYWQEAAWTISLILALKQLKPPKIALEKNFVSDNVTVILLARWEWESECCYNSDIFWLLSRITQTSSLRLFQMTIFFQCAGGFWFTGYSKHIWDINRGNTQWKWEESVGYWRKKRNDCWFRMETNLSTNKKLNPWSLRPKDLKENKK